MISSITGLNLNTIIVWLTKINIAKFSSITGLNLSTIRVWLTKINMDKFSSISQSVYSVHDGLQVQECNQLEEKNAALDNENQKIYKKKLVQVS